MTDLATLECKARAARPGPWQWYGNTNSYACYLTTVHSGRVFVMDFARWGMSSAQPRFQTDQHMTSLSALGKQEHPLGPSFEVPYRRQFVGIGHSDAQHIAANDPSTTLALIARIRELEAALEDIVDPCVSEGAHWPRMRGAREVLAKGAVLP